jgi:hypothetical protein
MSFLKSSIYVWVKTRDWSVILCGCMACASARLLEMAIHCVCIATSPEFATSVPKKNRVREMLSVWPAFPIAIWEFVGLIPEEDNTIAALEQRDRVCEIRLELFTRSQPETLVPLIQESFPALTKLYIVSHWRDERAAPVLGRFCPTCTIPLFGIDFIPSLTESASV